MKKLVVCLFAVVSLLLSCPDRAESPYTYNVLYTTIEGVEDDGTPYGHDQDGYYVAFDAGYQVGDSVQTVLVVDHDGEAVDRLDIIQE